MIRISLPYIYGLAAELEPLSSLPDDKTPINDVMLTLIVAEGAINSLATATIFVPYLRTSYELSQRLLSVIRRQTERHDTERELERYELWNIKNTYNQYKIALLAELGSFNVYFVTQKGGFDMYSLLMAGESLFPSDLIVKVPEAIVDAREAAKALAYEVPTSCGFHVFRVTESVLRKYYAHVTAGAPPPKVRNISVYLNAIKITHKGDEKILAALKQMTDLHRNPLIHPEVILTPEEAIATIGIARSVITAMLDVLPVQPRTTTTAVGAQSRPLLRYFRRNNLCKFALEHLFAFVAAKLTSGFNEPLVLSFVLRLRRSLLLFACFSHTASQILAVR